MAEGLLRAQKISYRDNDYFSIQSIDLEIEAGKIYQLVGATASGKTTLLKLLAGALPPSAGRIFWEGKPVRFHSQYDAATRGIVLIGTAPCLYENFSVADNVFDWEQRGLRWNNRNRRNERCRELFRELELDIAPEQNVRSLTSGQKRLLELAQVYARGVRVLLIDSPSDWMDGRELSKQFQIMEKIQRKYGPAVLVGAAAVDHWSRRCDGIFYLKYGQIVASVTGEQVATHEIPEDYRQKRLEYPKLEFQPGRTLLEFRHSQPKNEWRIFPQGFRLHAHEIVGFYGFDMERCSYAHGLLSGTGSDDGYLVYMDSQPVLLSSPSQAAKLGIACQPLSKSNAIFPNLSVRENLLPPNERIHGGLHLDKEEQFRAHRLIQQARIDVGDISTRCSTLGACTQQKVLLCRYLEQNSSVFLLFHPTFGMNAESKLDIYNLLTQMQQKDCGVILFSNDPDEMIYMCDRIVVASRDGESKVISGDLRTRHDRMYRQMQHCPEWKT